MLLNSNFRPFFLLFFAVHLNLKETSQPVWLHNNVTM